MSLRTRWVWHKLPKERKEIRRGWGVHQMWQLGGRGDAHRTPPVTVKDAEIIVKKNGTP